MTNLFAFFFTTCVCASLCLAVHAGNTVAVIAAHSNGAELLYPSHSRQQLSSETANLEGTQVDEVSTTTTKKKRKGSASTRQSSLEMDTIDKQLHAAIVDLAMRIDAGEQSDKHSTVSSAFAMAACRSSLSTTCCPVGFLIMASALVCLAPSLRGHGAGLWRKFVRSLNFSFGRCHRILSDKSPKRPVPRVLVVAPFEDLPGQYIAMMNSIFSFQKSGVLVDSLVFCDTDCRVRAHALRRFASFFLLPLNACKHHDLLAVSKRNELTHLAFRSFSNKRQTSLTARTSDQIRHKLPIRPSVSYPFLPFWMPSPCARPHTFKVLIR
jgi:hypothetical protein